MVGIAKWQIIVPEELTPTLVSQTHQATHLGYDKLEELVCKYFLVPHLSSPCRTESQKPHLLLTGQCYLSAWTETMGIQLKSMLPLEHLEVDFTEMKPH